ncbi:MAG TPA: PQQ-dependent sugar dehydrogenase [Cytophagales bacterium]|nr:PQQ-dependent sugar dehydrogenase [Cytophagales bacterium]
MLTAFRYFSLLTLSCFVFLSSCFSQELDIKEAFPNLKFDYPVEFIPLQDGSKRIFVLEQKGIIKVFKNETSVKETKDFLNISQQVESGGEKGLLGLAFHPEFKTNGYFYVNYTTGNDLITRISRFSLSKTNKEEADPGSELVLLTYEQPYDNHNGGKIAFGPDGFLYISAGDGGSGGDPMGNGQNLNTLLGKIMRIDVDKKAGNLTYAIPEDNPFKGNNEGYKEEIFAYGLRNVWKFSFDKKTSEIWAGDVGQNAIEEIDIIEKGGNYGWNIMEGRECFKKESCDKKGLKLPVYQYLQQSGAGRSITGGYVYRGKSIKTLNGWYVYGDYTTGNIWRLKISETGETENHLITRLKGAISSFGEDESGEIYVCSYGNGKIYKIIEK